MEQANWSKQRSINVDAASEKYRLDNELEALVIEAREKGGKKVSDIILNPDYAEYLNDIGKQKIRHISEDINGSVSAAERLIKQYKMERKEDRKWLGDVSDSFTIEKCI